MSNLRRIDKELYYNIIKNWAKEYGRSPSKEDFNKDESLPSSRTLEESLKIPWNVALKELGLEQIKDRSYYLLMDKKELLNAFKDEYKRINPLTRMDFNKKRSENFPNVVYLEKKLELKWNEILHLCNFETTREYYTKEEYKKIIIDLSEKLQRTPSITDFENSGYTLNSLLNKFDNKTYNEIIKSLALEINVVQNTYNFSKAELIELYIKLSKKLGYAAKTTDIDKEKNLPSYSTFSYYFSNINELRRAAGLDEEKTRGCAYSKEKILKILCSIHKKYKRRLTTAELKKELKENKFPSISTCYRYLNVTSIVAMWQVIEDEFKL